MTQGRQHSATNSAGTAATYPRNPCPGLPCLSVRAGPSPPTFSDVRFLEGGCSFPIFTAAFKHGPGWRPLHDVGRNSIDLAYLPLAMNAAGTRSFCATAGNCIVRAFTVPHYFLFIRGAHKFLFQPAPPPFATNPPPFLGSYVMRAFVPTRTFHFPGSLPFPGKLAVTLKHPGRHCAFFARLAFLPHRLPSTTTLLFFFFFITWHGLVGHRFTTSSPCPTPPPPPALPAL